MHPLKQYFRPIRTVFMPRKEKVLIKDSSVTFLDPDGFTKRTGIVRSVLQDDPADKYLGRHDLSKYWGGQGEEVSPEDPVMYWVLENGTDERWTVRVQNGVFNGQRGFLTSYGMDVWGEDYATFWRLKKLVMSNMVDVIDSCVINGVKLDTNGWVISGASETLASVWEEIVNA